MISPITKWDKDLVKGSPAYDFVIDDSKVIRVIAGPGAGKSFALQRRIMRLLEKECVSPEKILVITYSKVAAEYLKDDIKKISVDGVDRIVATTLHSLCYGLVANNPNIAPTRHLRLMQSFEQKPMLYDLGKDYGTLREKERRIRDFEAKLDANNNSDEQIVKDVMCWTSKHNAMLFGEIISYTIKYLEENPSCPELAMFDHVLVDEYQDLNKAEQKAVDLLSKNGALVVIGDDDQSIYSFKHAHPVGIRDFNKSHMNCSDHEFPECRRCPKTVVEIASRLIQHAENRIPRGFVPYNDNQIGEVIKIVSRTTQEEIEQIVGRIQAEKNTINLCDFLILTTTRSIAESLCKQLNALLIPAKSFFKESVLKTDQLKKVFSVLHLLANPEDMVALRYLLGQGGHQFRAKSYKRVLDYASEHKMTVIEVLKKSANKEIQIPYTYKLIQVYSDIVSELQKRKAAVSETPMELANILLEDTSENYEFIELLKIAINKTDFLKAVGLEEWLKQVCLDLSKLISLPENIVKGDFIKIMSLHSAKGLSAKYLVVMHVTEGLLPRESFGLKEHYQKYVEEIRRLFYVAVTRCKGNQPDYPGKLIIGTIEGKESRFIKELGILNPKHEGDAADE